MAAHGVVAGAHADVHRLRAAERGRVRDVPGVHLARTLRDGVRSRPSPTEFGFYYLFIAAGYFLGNWSVGRFMARHDLHWMVVIVVLLAAAGPSRRWHSWHSGSPTRCGSSCRSACFPTGRVWQPNVTATAVSLAPQHAGVGSSTIGFLQQIIGAAACSGWGLFPTDTALPMLVFCAVVCVLGVGMLYVFPRVEAGAPPWLTPAPRSPAHRGPSRAARCERTAVAVWCPAHPAQFRSTMTGYLGTPDYRHGSPARLGVLLVNLGTPDEPTTAAVRRYLAEFLWDPRVIEAPRALWWLILHGVILRTRPKRSAHAYQQVWTPQGSPLLVESRALAEGLSGRLAKRCGDRVRVELAMTYGNPSIPDALERLRRDNVQRLLVLPMYPQYSATTTASIFERVTAELSRWRWLPELRMVNQYWEEDAYIRRSRTALPRTGSSTGASTCCSRSTPFRSAISWPAIRTTASAGARRGAWPPGSGSPTASGRSASSRGSAARSGSSPTWTCCCRTTHRRGRSA